MYRYGRAFPQWTLLEKVVIALAGIGWLYVFLYDSPTIALFYSGLFVFSIVIRGIAGMPMWISGKEPLKTLAYGLACLATLLITNSIIYSYTGSYSLPLSTSSTTAVLIETQIFAPLIRSIFIAVAEEETFRGIVLDFVKETPTKADEYFVLVSVSGVGFSLAHAKAWYGSTTITGVFTAVAQNPAPFLVGVTGGIILGLIALKARNLAPSIVAHAIYDFLAFAGR